MASTSDWSGFPEDLDAQPSAADQEDFVPLPQSIPDDVPEADALEQLEEVPLDDEFD